MESAQDFGTDVNDASLLPKAEDLAEFGFVETADSDLERENLGADGLDLGFDDADIRKELMSLGFIDDDDNAPWTREDAGIKDLPALNDAEALDLQERINERFWEEHEKLWSVAD